MRFYNTGKSINENIYSEIDASMADALQKIRISLHFNPKDVPIKLDFENDYVRLITQKDHIVNTYYSDLKIALLGKLSMNTEKTNSILLGKFQLHTLLNYLMIEGTVCGVNNIIMSTNGFADVIVVTHYNFESELQLLTYDYYFKLLKELDFNLEARLNSDAHGAIYQFYENITKLYLHLAIDKLYKEGLFDLHLKNRPFHIYFGEPNYYHCSLYYILKIINKFNLKKIN